jgi:hypothetical protein
MTTKEKVIALLAEERKRARDIAYSYKHDYDSKAKHGIKSLQWHYKKIADLFRQLGNNISGSHALSDDTMEERIAREYEKELKEFENGNV